MELRTVVLGGWKDSKARAATVLTRLPIWGTETVRDGTPRLTIFGWRKTESRRAIPWFRAHQRGCSGDVGGFPSGCHGVRDGLEILLFFGGRGGWMDRGLL